MGGWSTSLNGGGGLGVASYKKLNHRGHKGAQGETLRPLWLIFYFVNDRRSCPVMSLGSGSPNIPRTVGEMSRNEPLGLSVNCLAFSETTINGTGFVVCAVCGPPVFGSIIISAFP